MRRGQAADSFPLQQRKPRIDLAARPPGLTVLERTVNGQPGLIAQLDGVTVAVLAFHIAGDQIKHIWEVPKPRTSSGPGPLADARLHGIGAAAAQPPLLSQGAGPPRPARHITG